MSKSSNNLLPLRLLIRRAENLETKTKMGFTSSIHMAKFAVHAAVTTTDSGEEGHDPPPGDFKVDWTKTSENEAFVNEEAVATCSWSGDPPLELSSPHADAKVEVVLYRYFERSFKNIKEEVGRTTMTVRELAEMDEDGEGGGGGIELLLFDSGGDVVAYPSQSFLPVLLRVSLENGKRLRKELRIPPPAAAAKSTGAEEGDEGGKVGGGRAYDRHLMIVTRGTRGDVQPFVALARGLAELRNWEITIVTENEYKRGIKSQSSVEAGAIHWRPSGGDTMRRVQAPLSQKAINIKINAKQSNAMQKIFLSRSEREFFNSEPAVYYWASKIKPDYLMFGFTMVSIAMIASEALKIPLIGFVLQPTSIPSKTYPPVLPLKEEHFKLLMKDPDMMKKKHDQLKLLKYLMESAPMIQNANSSHQPVAVEKGLDSLRKRRGLRKFESYHSIAWQELLDGNYPLIVPINETMFGGKPRDWSENAVFTDCIFLRGNSVPPIALDAQDFLGGARSMDGKVVVLAFSSMPVSKSQIVSIALKLIKECIARVCVFALVGGQIDLPLGDVNLKDEAQAAIDGGRLFLAGGAPFGRLFPLVDAVVLHGGLGTTSEAIQAQVPAIVTGVLLLDQRFWGARCASLGVGPFGTHIVDFPDKCVEYVDRAVSKDSEWRINAQQIGQLMTEEAKDDPSGVRRNVECVVRMSEVATYYQYDPTKSINSRNIITDGIKTSLREKKDEWGVSISRHKKKLDEFDSDEIAYLQVI